MNHSALASIVSEDVTFIGCTYEKQTEYKSTHRKVYHFKTSINDVKVGDILIVTSNEGTLSYENGFAIVKVAELDVAVDYNSDRNYHWAFQKVDTEGLKTLIENEQAMIKQVQKLETASKRKQLIAALAEKGIDLAKVTMKRLA